ncbi:MAG: hypothetical protein NT027_17735, partial [Proteobacteria bacterium]|nr:hypothetical protein [Pseudomonadota bacterium]
MKEVSISEGTTTKKVKVYNLRNDVKIKIQIFAVLGAYFCLASELQGRTLSTLFYLEMKPDGCYWVKQDVVGLKKEELHRTKDCPEEIVWDSKQKRVVYSQNKTIFQADHKKMDNPKAIGLIPGNVSDFMLVITASGEVRTATMELLKESDVQKQIIGNDTRYTYVSGKEKLEALNLFEEGQFYKADVHRYIGGKAQKIASYLTKWGSVGTYGLTVARRDMIPGPKTVNLTSEKMRYIILNAPDSTDLAP